MSLTAKQLSKSGGKGREIDGIVREQLRIIDDRLQRHERTWGRNILVCDLPYSFAFPGLEKKDAQRVIYCAIMRSLLNRLFDVRILLIPDRTTLYITWLTDLGEEEIRAMNKLIRHHRIQDGDDLDRFLARETENADAGV